MIYLILALALVLRLVLINQSFWLDEAATLLTARLPLSNLFPAMAGEFHPPLLHLIMHFWLSFGNYSEWFLRLPSIFAGLGTIYFLYLTLIHLFPQKRSIALLAVFLLSISPLHIYYSQELRMYSLSAFFTTSSWYLLLRLLDEPKSKLFFSLFLLTCLGNLYSFYGSFFILAAQLVFVLFYHRRFLFRLLVIDILLFLSYLPWLPFLAIQLKGGQWLTQTLPGWKLLSGSLTLKSLLLIPAKFSLGRINFGTQRLYLFAAASTTIYFLSLVLLGLKNKKLTPFIYWLTVPLIAATLISFKTPILGYWRYVFLLPSFFGLIAAGLNFLPRSLRLLNIFIVTITMALSNLLFWVTPAFQREHWREAVSFVQSETSAVSIFAFSDAFAPVRWYAPTLTYTAPLQDLTVDPSLLDLNLSQAVKDKEKVYYFEYLSGLTDPHGNIRSWLTNAGFAQVNIHDFSGVGFVYEYQTSR